MPIDLRTISREKLLRLGDVVSYGWKDKPSGQVWPALKLYDDQRLILWDGREVRADAGDYIVRCEDGPKPVYGRVSYFAHETQFNVKPVNNPPAF